MKIAIPKDGKVIKYEAGEALLEKSYWIFDDNGFLVDIKTESDEVVIDTDLL